MVWKDSGLVLVNPIKFSPNASIAFIILLTIPIIVASAKISFFKIKINKILFKINYVIRKIKWINHIIN